MTLAAQDIEQIEALIHRVLAERESKTGMVRYDLELCERLVRVEEELKHQRELMFEGFKQMEKRFEQIDKRFEQVDKRFEEMLKRHDQHFLWLVGLIATSSGLVIAALRLL